MDFIYNDPSLLPLLEQKADLLKRVFYDRQCRNDYRHFSRFEPYFNLLLERNQNNSSLYEADLTLAALLLNAMRGEFYNRSVLDQGDLYYEDYHYYKFYEQEFEQYLSMLEQYIQQSDADSSCRSWIWGVYFLNEYLTEELLEKTWTVISANEEARWEWFPNNYQNPHDLCEEEEFLSSFIGLYPVIDPISGIRSVLTLKYSASLTYGFLRLPEEITDSFHDSIPSYLHELIHYTPPQSRASRNRLAIHLILYSVLNEWTNEIYRIGREMGINRRVLKQIDELYFHRLLDKFYDYLLTLYCGSPERREEGEPLILLDSMNMAILQSEMFYYTSPEQFISLLEETEWDEIDLPADSRKEFKDQLDQLFWNNTTGVRLRSIWKYAADSYATTYNILLRELRSDITAFILLGIKLKDYIRIMMLEKDFAVNSAEIAADETLYRFGYMTRYLFHRYEKDSALSAEEDICLWRKCCDDIFEQLQDEDYDHHLDNLRTYLDAYEDMAIEKYPGCRTKQYGSFFEELLEDEVEKWSCFAESLYNYPRISYLRDIWENPKSHNLPEEFLKLSETLFSAQ